MDLKIKQARYERVFTQLQELCKQTTDPVARMSTATALLHHKFNYYFWTGFYQFKQGELTVGPYQGPVACLVLPKDTGVCWAALNQASSLIVPDVDKFPGHIACDSRSRSEIVVPVKNENNQIIALLDVDSKFTDSFDEIDKEGLEKIVELIYKEVI